VSRNVLGDHADDGKVRLTCGYDLPPSGWSRAAL